MGGATFSHEPANIVRGISIHAPRVGSDLCPLSDPEDTCPISIHAPRVGSDELTALVVEVYGLFQSTLPVWGATERQHLRGQRHGISIHAPRVGGDGTPASTGTTPRDFNPRSPCGERRNASIYGDNATGFQSTLPVWGATPYWSKAIDLTGISIHAPRVGSDRGHSPERCRNKNFNPRSPCGERRTSSTL